MRIATSSGIRNASQISEISDMSDMSIIHYTEQIFSTVDWFCPNCSNALSFASCSDTSFQEVFSDPNGQLNSRTSDTNLLCRAPPLDLPSNYTRNSINGLLLNAQSIHSKQHQLQNMHLWNFIPWTLSASQKLACQLTTLTFFQTYKDIPPFGMIVTVDAVALWQL